MGAVQTALTFTSPGASTTESGCVAAGIGGTTVTGPAACPAGFAGGDELAINNTYTAASLGLTDFNNLQVIFNPVEPQSGPFSGYYARTPCDYSVGSRDGLILDAKYTAAPIFFPIRIRAPATQDSGLCSMPLKLRTSTFCSLHSPTYESESQRMHPRKAGLETISFRATNITAIPEPSTYALLGSALAALALLRRKVTLSKP